MTQRTPRLIFLLNSAQRRLRQWIGLHHAASAHADTLAPTPAQSGVLFVLAKANGSTMGQFASALDLAPSAVSGLIRCAANPAVQGRVKSADGKAVLVVWIGFNAASAAVRCTGE